MQRGSGDPHDRTPEDVDADLGRVIVKAVDDSGSARRWSKWLFVSVVFNVLLSVGVIFAVVDGNTSQRKACERQNVSNAGQLKLWGPILAAPRAPLKPNATAAERKAYDEAGRVREQFQRDLHKYFDPLAC